ncbi:hypothetical protein AYO27_18105 [Rhizobium sp. GHKF11]|nr:hypothetical protein AYO27_18105 [Rhizobium sp. GHKF11]
MSSKSGQPRPGSQYGSWTLMTRIDGGGNADVWAGRNSESRTVAAIKILHNLGKEPLSRFKNEVKALRDLGSLNMSFLRPKVLVLGTPCQ